MLRGSLPIAAAAGAAIAGCAGGDDPHSATKRLRGARNVLAFTAPGGRILVNQADRDALAKLLRR